MATDLAILVPVLGRPHRVKPLLYSIEATVKARVLFIADPWDSPELHALEEAEAEYITFSGSYAAKIAEGLKETTESLIFTGADDLYFHPGWFERASAKLGNGIEVVGINDLVRRRRDHQTHFLMTREYAERDLLDGSPGPFHLGYRSWYCDDELIATAKHRGAYAYASDSIVEHLHPFAGKAPDDETYRIGRRHSTIDRRLFDQRSQLWAST